MKNILSIVSGKGGAGKSTCSVGIAAALCKLDKRVLLIDMDAGLRCLDLMLSVDEELVFDLADVLEGKELIDSALPCKKIPGLSLLAAPQKSCEIDGEKLYRFLLSVRGFDYIILDFPAGIEFPYLPYISEISDFIVVTGADKVGMRDSDITTRLLSDNGCECRLIINKYERELVKRGVFGGIDDIIDASGCRLLGIVPFDKKMVKHGAYNKRGLTNKAFLRIAKRIYGYEIPLPHIKKIQKGK